MNLPGPNQTRSADRRARPLPSEVLAHMARPRIKRPAEISAAALRIDPVERDYGYADGLAGARWDLGTKDPLSYGTGYIVGVEDRRRKKGG